ncbi:type II toxin-antitoxin system HicB family antitoxin [Planktothrix agardhii 1029]|jgi:predicted RNase H-like HicB family nuclease|uniref:type II toxin-antitoxin system HicB family antitoxin n=1 Tax=Planktothrix agardhii TaxID=1160 RepID=UPI001D09D30D|nr:type II toxin-antitoxin system HicB family antitoxin [Planktothrix agardhii]MCB8763432.1 type II toxin-antitoxin system HicB family antitoxin [Planktothrix agardhii 1809]MCB8777085.1 type II toxin-antitoxin system HicB family antitoxin [Planktothrix agardhii 1031]MCB8781512.1 type II toxin-antitoxin system HicB family antitoxin [Planktothrix agardhii 1808]MCF3567302.1 type II toxin-antitoxin system HicB family antitoxin [Planktothrix agardhii 1807]MCF3590639.1 type II toxin-antitoxin system
MKEYIVIFEWAGSNYSAYVPDLPGCISTGKTLEETENNIKEAIELYIDTLREDGQAIPEPSLTVKAISVAA